MRLRVPRWTVRSRGEVPARGLSVRGSLSVLGCRCNSGIRRPLGVGSASRAEERRNILGPEQGALFYFLSNNDKRQTTNVLLIISTLMREDRENI